MRTVITHWSDQRARFLVIGAWNTAFGYAVFVVLYLLLYKYVHYIYIALMAHAVAVSVAYLGQRILVFRSRGYWLSEFIRYNLSLLMGLAIGMLMLWSFVTLLAFSPIIAQAIVTALGVFLNYLMHSRFSFSSGDRIS